MFRGFIKFLVLFLAISALLCSHPSINNAWTASFCYFEENCLSPSVSLNVADIKSGFANSARLNTINNGVLLSQSSKTIRGFRREFSLPKTYEQKIEYSARAFLPYTKILTAVNILLKHEKIDKIKKIRVNFQGHEDSAILKNGTLYISVQAPEQISTPEMLQMFIDDLGWDFTKAIEELKNQYPFLLVSSNEFDAINVIIHERLAGLGDLVFVSNAGQVFSSMLPHKTIRLIFHSDEDFKLVCSTKILKGLDPEKAFQKTGGMEIINADALGKTMPNSSGSSFGMESQPWYIAQEEVIGGNDISFVYALGGTAKEILQDSYRLKMYAGKAKASLFVYELGFASLTKNPLLSGDIHFGFGEDEIGMPPVSPVSEIIYAKKYPRVEEHIQDERKRIIKKFGGWEKLNTVLGQTDLEKTIASEWGFLYAHMDRSVKSYFRTFERARENNPGFNEETTFFVMCGRGDKQVIAAVKQLSDTYDYNLLIYGEEGELSVQNSSRKNNVTIVMDYSVPRKLFSELFLYSDDLPTLVSGQDNLANIVYLNLLTTGRPFFWEVLIFQSTALLDMLSYLRDVVGEEEAGRFRMLVDNILVNEDIEGVFVRPSEYRRFFKKISQALDRHKSFISQVYYLMLRFGQDRKFRSDDRAQALIDKLRAAIAIKKLQKLESPLDNSLANINGNTLTYLEQAI